MTDTLDGLAYAANFVFSVAAGTKFRPDQLRRGMSVMALPTEELQSRNEGVHSDHDIAHQLLQKTPHERCYHLLELIASGREGRGVSAPISKKTTYRILRHESRYLPEEPTLVWTKVLDQYKINNNLPSGSDEEYGKPLFKL